MSEHWAYFVFWISAVGIGVVIALAILGWIVTIHECLNEIKALLKRGF